VEVFSVKESTSGSKLDISFLFSISSDKMTTNYLGALNDLVVTNVDINKNIIEY